LRLASGLFLQLDGCPAGFGDFCPRQGPARAFGSHTPRVGEREFSRVFVTGIYLPQQKRSLLDLPVEQAGFEPSVPVRQAKLTRSCR